ncbi:MAG: hypothetical protein OXI40_10260 [Chloroflexota bacterium]|nr:hypothetical protein [Chloroflexota bacterium]
MTDREFFIQLFCRVDDQMKDVPKHSQAKMYPSELATLGILFALKGKGCRAFYHGVSRNFSDLFPKLLQRTRFFRALKQQRVHLCRASFLAGKSLNLGAAGQCLRDPRRPRWLIANNLKYTPTDPLD